MSQMSEKRIPRRVPPLFPRREISPEEMAKRQAELDDFAQRSYKIFDRLYPELVSDYYNWHILIEPDSEDYFMDKDELVAFKKAREKYPHGKFFFFRLNEKKGIGTL